MVSELVADQEDVDAPTPPRRHDDQVRAAAIAFAVIEVAGFLFYAVAGRNLWFYRDEWDFLANKGFNAHDLIQPHGGHLSIIPVAVYRAMQRNHSMTVEQATAAQGLTVGAFRDLERRIESDDLARDDARRALAGGATPAATPQARR